MNAHVLEPKIVSTRLRLLTMTALLCAVTGCGARPVGGGTKGVLHYAGKSLSDIQVTVYQLDGGHAKPVGFGVTNHDGLFRLVKNTASGPLWLAPGDYRCTLESAGSPVRLPKEYASAETTPLKVSWTGGSQNLELEAPSHQSD